MSSRITKAIGISGVITGYLFFGSMVIFFFLKPMAYEDFNTVSIAAYNLAGMEVRPWAAVSVYGLTGLSNVVFSILLIANHKGQFSPGLIGAIFLLLSGMIWLSFGIFLYDFTTSFGNHFLVIRLIVFLLASFLGLLLLGAEYKPISNDNFLKVTTLSSAGLIAILSVLSIFEMTIDSWVRSNLSIIVYFMWCIIAGSRIIVKGRG